eukprot:scaffold650_cov407-Prasinococcus_capsulatus_cf.AAC.15
MTAKTGAYRYMAPEVFLGEEYGLSADVYSFGIIAYQMLGDGSFSCVHSTGRHSSSPLLFAKIVLAVSDRLKTDEARASKLMLQAMKTPRRRRSPVRNEAGCVVRTLSDARYRRELREQNPDVPSHFPRAPRIHRSSVQSSPHGTPPNLIKDVSHRGPWEWSGQRPWRHARSTQYCEDSLELWVQERRQSIAGWRGLDAIPTVYMYYEYNCRATGCSNNVLAICIHNAYPNGRAMVL